MPIISFPALSPIISRFAVQVLICFHFPLLKFTHFLVFSSLAHGNSQSCLQWLLLMHHLHLNQNLLALYFYFCSRFWVVFGIKDHHPCLNFRKITYLLHLVILHKDLHHFQKYLHRIRHFRILHLLILPHFTLQLKFTPLPKFTLHSFPPNLPLLHLPILHSLLHNPTYLLLLLLPKHPLLLHQYHPAEAPPQSFLPPLQYPPKCFPSTFPHYFWCVDISA